MSEKTLVSFEERGQITVGSIHATSVLDALNVNAFGNAVLQFVQDHPTLNLLLDFHQVDYLSSAVLTELLRVKQACAESSGQLRLCGLNPDIRKVFEITNLDKMFVMYGAVDEAVMRYTRSLAIEAEEQAWARPQKDA